MYDDESEGEKGAMFRDYIPQIDENVSLLQYHHHTYILRFHPLLGRNPQIGAPSYAANAFAEDRAPDITAVLSW